MPKRCQVNNNSDKTNKGLLGCMHVIKGCLDYVIESVVMLQDIKDSV